MGIYGLEILRSDVLLCQPLLHIILLKYGILDQIRVSQIVQYSIAKHLKRLIMIIFQLMVLLEALMRKCLKQ